MIILVCGAIVGCIPKSAQLKSRDLQAIEVGYVSDGSGEKILKDDNAVDQLATDVIDLMLIHGFEARHTSVSFGIQPWTGHTQDAYFRLVGSERISCIVEISKTAFSARFEEIEVAPQSDEFLTSKAELSVVRQAAIALNDFASERFPGRSIRVSVFNNPLADSVDDL